jgi:hypothetical protein
MGFISSRREGETEWFRVAASVRNSPTGFTETGREARFCVTDVDRAMDRAASGVVHLVRLRRWPRPISLARRERASAFAGIEGYTPINLSVAGTDEAESFQGAAVSAGLFDLLGTPPAKGRLFRREE